MSGKVKKILTLFVAIASVSAAAVGLSACGGNGGSGGESTGAGSTGLDYVVFDDYCVVAGIGTCEDNDIIIPATYENKPVIGFAYASFKGLGKLTSVTIPNSVTYIGNSAFYGCSGLTSITIPDSVTSIGYDAFSHCSSLTEINYNATECAGLNQSGVFSESGRDEVGITVNIGANVKKIPKLLFGTNFASSVKIVSVRFAEGSVCESIEGSAFRNCSLTTITIPDSVTSIGNMAFYSCDSLTNITIPDSVTSIGGSAFSSCDSLTSITIPDSVTSLENSLFKDCVALKHITIGNGVTSIGENVFYNCPIESVTLPGSVIKLVDRINLPQLKTVEITNGAIGAEAFMFDKLTSVVIGDGVTEIGELAFFNCDALTSVTIGNGVTKVGANAFDYCDSCIFNEYDNAYYLGNSVNPYAALICAKDENISGCNVHNDTKCISESAFQNCTSLTDVTISGGVVSLEGSAFKGCTSLTSITVNSDNKNYSDLDGVLFNKDKTILMCYPAGKTETAYTIPDSVTSIVEQAFFNCTALTGVTIGCGVTSMGNLSFFQCAALTDITVNAENTNYSDLDGVLFNKDKTTLIRYPEGKTATAYTIPDCVTSVGNSAFYGCSSLTRITIGNGVERIESHAFYGCSSLTSITIPENVSEIGDYAFYSCKALKNATFKVTEGWEVTSIDYTHETISVSSSKLTDTEVAADCLRTNYSNYSWKKN
ncbi:MAG: leucine-rich repeat domain-containing protein [Candidatus Coproplasma sp.]